MKKILFSLFLSLPCFTYAATEVPDAVWQSINSLWDRLIPLERQVKNLRDQVNNLPKPTEKKKHFIGEHYHGGIIFWLDETSEHGLIASLHDANQGKGLQWRNGESGNKITNARADGIGAGENNTQIIIAQQTIDQQKGIFAALLAANYQVEADGITPCKTPIRQESTCFGGWYLPSAFELSLMRNNLQQQGLSAFAPDFYWSSTESTASTAWMINFATGDAVASLKSSVQGQVRAVSRF